MLFLTDENNLDSDKKVEEDLEDRFSFYHYHEYRNSYNKENTTVEKKNLSEEHVTSQSSFLGLLQYRCGIVCTKQSSTFHYIA